MTDIDNNEGQNVVLKETIIPLKSFEIVTKPILFCLGKSKATHNDHPFSDKSLSRISGKKGSNSNHSILNVLDTYRPPDHPKYWFHPPGILGSFHWKDIKKVGKGHHNFANTCFLNATIQSLAYCPPFAQDCIRGRHTLHCARRERKEVCGFCQFELHIKNLLTNSDDRLHQKQQQQQTTAPWNPTMLRLMTKEIKMNRGAGGSWYGAQNCAHEWLVQFLDFLTKYDLPSDLQHDFETGRMNSSELSTCYLHQIFSGNFQESKTCNDCFNSSIRYELNSCIRVALNGTSCLKKALSASFEPELLTGGNRPMCENCGIPRDKTSNRFIERPPNVLVLLLQRTEFRMEQRSSFFSKNSNKYYPHIQKNCTKMDIPIELDLSPFISPERKKTYPLDNNNNYRFIASVNHSGSAGFGHYWAVVHGPDGSYYKLDDERRTLIPPSNLLEQLSSAYLLFYLRQTPVQHDPNVTFTLYKSIFPSVSYSTLQENDIVQPWNLRLCMSIIPSRLSLLPCLSSNQQILGCPDQSNFKTIPPHDDINTPQTLDFKQRINSSYSLPIAYSDDSTDASLEDHTKRQVHYKAKTLLTMISDTTSPDKIIQNEIIEPNKHYPSTTNLDSRLYVYAKRHIHLSRRLQYASCYSKLIRQRQHQYVEKERHQENVQLLYNATHVNPLSLKLSTSVTDISNCDHYTPELMESNEPMCPPAIFDSSSLESKRLLNPVQNPVDIVSPISTTQHNKTSCQPFKSEFRIEKAKRIQSQFGYTSNEVDTWDNEDKHQKILFHSLQKTLLPKTTKRSREDKQYDKGKLKKIKSGISKQQTIGFAFTKAAERYQFKSQRLNNTHH